MKFTLLLFTGLMFCLRVSANHESVTTDTMRTDTEKVLTLVEVMPEFPGGVDGLMTYLKSTIKYPKAARKKNITGKVYITFVIDKTGKVKDARVLRGIDPECDAEALRAINEMPEWTPGSQDGKNVQVQFNIPIAFYLR